MSLEEEIGQLLIQRGLVLAVAETTAGGLISSRIVSVPGSSRYFALGIVAYGRRAKADILKVSEQTLAGQGSVSAEAAAAMAEGVRRAAGCQIGLAESGIAGPIQGRSPKPIGTVYIAIRGPGGGHDSQHQFPGDRSAIRLAMAEAALRCLSEYLKTLPC